jgi:hypothetical protein
MATSELKIIIDANGGPARAELGALQKELKQTGAAAAESGEKQAGANKRVGLSLTDMASGLSLAKQGFQAVEGAVKSVIDPFVSYANEVEDLGRNSGISAAQSSKLIQVADDLRINFDTLKTATRELNKDGIQPSFENLRDLATQYQAIEDPVKRAQFATAHFGRSAQEMTKFLETNTTQLDAMSAAVERSGLMLDEEGVAKAKDYQAAMDDAEDSITAVKMALAQGLIPALTGVLKAETDAIDVNKRYDAALKAGMLTANDVAKIRDADMWGHREEALAVLAAAEAQWKHNAAIDAHAEKLNEDVPVVMAATSAYSGMVGVAIESESALQRAAVASQQAGAMADYLAGRTQAAASATDAMIRAHKSWLEGEAGDLISQLGAAGLSADAYALAEQRIDAIYGTNFAGQDEHKKKVKAIIDEYLRTGDIDAFGAHLRAMNDGPASEAAANQEQLYLDLVNTSKVLDPMPEILKPAAEQFGALGRNSQTAAEALAAYDQMPEVLRPAVEAFGTLAFKAGAATDAINSVPKDTHISVTTDYYDLFHRSGGPGGGQDHDYAGGVDMIVPPGYPDDSFRMNVQSGEHVLVEPAGSWDAPPMAPMHLNNAGSDSQAAGWNGAGHQTVINNVENVMINDQLAVALYNERRRQRSLAQAEALM